MAKDIELLATCWTSAGDVVPLGPHERSPFPISTRIEAAADIGWSGIGIGLDDLKVIRDTTGFGQVRTQIEDAGLKHVEVEFLSNWWITGGRRAEADRDRDILFEAAQELGARHIKMGTAIEPPVESLEPLIQPLSDLADAAERAGVLLAFEAEPFTMVPTIPLSAELVRAVDSLACGLLVDSWHVFRGKTSFDELREALQPRGIVFGVEVDDAAAGVVGTLFEDTIHERLLCGEGTFDLTGFLLLMQEVGFNGPWGVEIISRTHRARPLSEALTIAYDTAMQTFECAGSRPATRTDESEAYGVLPIESSTWTSER